jgi:hypothetical protein
MTRHEVAASPPAVSPALAAPVPPLPLWQLNRLRVGYLVMGIGLVVVKWPLLVGHGPWELKDGTVECLLVAMSVLAFVGLRYPLRLLPILLFEVLWKVLWLAVIAGPLWQDGTLDGDTRKQAGAILWVIVVIGAVPWRYAFAQYARRPGDPWRRRR